MVAGYPLHIIQRGHNKQVVFAGPEDFERYVADMRELKEAFGIRIHAYCLMTNHVHLLLAPRDSPAAMGKFMKALAGRATRYRNRLEGRSGTLWEGRYKSSLVQSDAYLLACCRYIELNPVRARMVAAPQHYRWSSTRERLGKESRGLLDWHPTYQSLGRSEPERRESYVRFLGMAVPQGEWQLIRDAVQRGQLTGIGKFVDEIEQIAGARIELRARGRPRKATGEGKKDEKRADK